MSEFNINELAERKIRPVSESLESDGILKMKLHVAGFQTILRLIFLNLSRLSRGNGLALDGMLAMPRSSGKLMDKIAGAHES